MIEINKTYNIDALEGLKMLPDESIDCIVTSPPYWMQRDYGVSGQIELESHFEYYIQKLYDVFDEAYRVLRSTGSIWINMGDTYSTQSGRAIQIAKGKSIHETAYSKTKKICAAPSGVKTLVLKRKCLCMIPERFAIKMISRGWILRNKIIWHKLNAMPASVKDRFTVDFEEIYFFTKNPKYYFEQQLEPALGYDGRKDTKMKGSKKYAAKDSTGQTIQSFAARGHERWSNTIRGYSTKDGGTGLTPQYHGQQIATYPARNKRSVWRVPTKPLKEAHFAAYPEALITPCILAGCPENGIVLDPFHGSGTTGRVANKHNRNYIGFELNPEYIAIEKKLK